MTWFHTNLSKCALCESLSIGIVYTSDGNETVLTTPACGEHWQEVVEKADRLLNTLQCIAIIEDACTNNQLPVRYG